MLNVATISNYAQRSERMVRAAQRCVDVADDLVRFEVDLAYEPKGNVYWHAVTVLKFLVVDSKTLLLHPIQN